MKYITNIAAMLIGFIIAASGVVRADTYVPSTNYTLKLAHGKTYKAGKDLIGAGMQSNADPINFESWTAPKEVNRVVSNFGHTAILYKDGTMQLYSSRLFKGEFANISAKVVDVAINQDQIIVITETGKFLRTFHDVAGSFNTWSSFPSSQIGLATEPMIDIEAGQTFFVALDQLGRVWTYGIDQNSVLGQGSSPNQNGWAQPLVINNYSNIVVDIDADSFNWAAVDANGAVWVAGANGHGQLGNGSTSFSYVPVKSNLPEPATKAEVGNNRVFVYTSANDMYVTGYHNLDWLANIAGTRSVFMFTNVTNSILNKSVEVKDLTVQGNGNFALITENGENCWYAYGSYELGFGTAVANSMYMPTKQWVPMGCEESEPVPETESVYSVASVPSAEQCEATTITEYVTKEVPVVEYVEVIKEVPQYVEVIKEVPVVEYVEVPVEVQVPQYIEVPKYIEVPVEVVKTVEVIKEVPVYVEVIKEVIKEVVVYVPTTTTTATSTPVVDECKNQGKNCVPKNNNGHGNGSEPGDASYGVVDGKYDSSNPGKKFTRTKSEVGAAIKNLSNTYKKESSKIKDKAAKAKLEKAYLDQLAVLNAEYKTAK